ncbi:DUF5959 family protein [Streptomyces sp. NPDC058067]|uniref:DUF5959 family protein n=1 Tax=Streptomyces sp. NPDC058067 TaxID=3346324 RepID=UPI0036E44847
MSEPFTCRVDRKSSGPRPIITVDDSDESGVLVRVVLDPEIGWVDELREQLVRARLRPTAGGGSRER